MASAISRGLVSCHTCGLLSRLDGREAAHCPRCLARLHARKPDSLSRTWALVLLAYVLYIPANLLPILESRALLTAESNTIMSGILLFWEGGSRMIAALVFIASVVVPLTKLFALTWRSRRLKKPSVRIFPKCSGCLAYWKSRTTSSRKTRTMLHCRRTGQVNWKSAVPPERDYERPS